MVERIVLYKDIKRVSLSISFGYRAKNRCRHRPIQRESVIIFSCIEASDLTFYLHQVEFVLLETGAQHTVYDKIDLMNKPAWFKKVNPRGLVTID